MTTAEMSQRLRCFQDVIREGEFHEIAVRDTIAQQSYRIFTQGKNADGGVIGYYDTKRPLYINPKKSPRAKAGRSAFGGRIAGLYPLTGKTGKDTFKSGKKHRTRYVQSYAHFRQLIGLDAGVVKLLLFGNLKSDYENGGRGTGIVPLKMTNHRLATTLDEENNKKREGLEKKYGDVFSLTKDEERMLGDVGSKELILALDRCLRRS